MKKLPFKESLAGSIGIELEYQMVDLQDYYLVSCAKDLLKNAQKSVYLEKITPEATQSTIEINSSVHNIPHLLLQEMMEIQKFLLDQADQLDFAICGGGIHPFDKWNKLKIYPSSRYKHMADKYRYMMKLAITYGQHIHIGCSNEENALYLTHAFMRYVPQLIAIAASSPFYDGMDTDYSSSRLPLFSAFPTCGIVPYIITWSEFSDYYYKMCDWGLISSMKDLHWDVRPKPEFGTVEIRVCDTPLTLQKAVQITAYIQALAHYLLLERSQNPCPELHYLYNYNRFHACRYGYSGIYIDPYTSKHCCIKDDILNTIEKIKSHAQALGSTEFIISLEQDVKQEINDALILRHIFKDTGSLPKMIAEQCKIWSKNYKAV